MYFDDNNPTLSISLRFQRAARLREMGKNGGSLPSKLQCTLQTKATRDDELHDGNQSSNKHSP